MPETSPSERERFSAIIESTVVGARKEHLAIFAAELNMLKFLFEQSPDEATREQIIAKAHSLYRNCVFTLNRIEEYRAIGVPVTEDSAERGE